MNSTEATGNILAKNTPFQHKLGRSVFLTLGWHYPSSNNPCLLFLFTLEHLATIEFHQLEFFPSVKLNKGHVD